MFDIVYFKNEKGECPLLEYFQMLVNTGRVKDLAIIQAKINLLKDYGYELPRISTNHAKHIEGKLYELRPGDNRILYFYYNQGTYVLLHAFMKKTNKTPSHEIEKANKEIKEYERMKKYGTKK